MLSTFNAFGGIQVRGKAMAIFLGDVAVKAAEVSIEGYELINGGGLVAVYFSGDVGAISAAIEAVRAAAAKSQLEISSLVIPRPAAGLENCLAPHKQVCPEAKSDETETNEVISSQVPAPDVAADMAAENITVTDIAVEDIVAAAGMQDQEPRMAKKSTANVCNLCHDPACPRQKGDPHSKCIHHKTK